MRGNRPGGPHVEGYWDDGAVAERNLGEVGLYSSGEAVIHLAEQAADSRYTVAKAWSRRTGTVAGDVA
ncbi:hypothetical protein [Streptomyces violascens]|uniref:hypothetical protein n=1 Tax=Streptomyces violascens TaxID=67381 RepID=UPI00368ADAF9